MRLGHLLATISAVSLTAAVVPAQGADLAVVEPVDFVRICDAFGNGFYFLPGTETCLRVRGRIRTDYNVFFDLGDDADVEDFGFDDFDDEGYRFRARGYLYLDSRTQTELGLLRTFLEMEFTQDNDDDLDEDIENAFIELGGLILGRTDSFYDFPDAEFTPTQFFDAGFSDTEEQNLVGYNFAFDNGFNIGIAVEDNGTRSSGIADLTGGALTQPTRFLTLADTVTDTGDQKIPDVVGSIELDQEWGAIKVAAASHYVEAGLFATGTRLANGNVVDVRETEEEFGFAVGGSLVVNVPFGLATEAGVTSTFAHGAASYASTDISAPLDLDADGVFGIDGDLELTDFFSVSGGFSTGLAPNVSFATQVGFLYADVADVDTDLDGDGVLDNADFDYSNLDVQGFVSWTPVSGLILGVGAEYRYVDTEDFEDSSLLTTYFRAQRSF